MFKKKQLKLTFVILAGLLILTIIGVLTYKQVSTLNFKHRNDYVYLSISGEAKFITGEHTIYLYAFDKEAKNDDDYKWFISAEYKNFEITLIREDKVYIQENTYPYFLNEISKKDKVKIYQLNFYESGSNRRTFYAVKLKDLNINLKDFDIRVTFYEKE